MGKPRLTRGTSFAVDERIRSDPASMLFFSLIGVGYLFPFCAMTQPVDYWKELFPDISIDFALTAVYNYGNLLLLTCLVFFTPHESTGSGFLYRISIGFIGQLVSLAIVPTSYFFYPSENVDYWLILACMALMAFFTACLDSAVISFGSLYPTKMQEKMQLGIGLSTLIGSVFRVLTKGVFPPGSVVSSSLAYFYCGVIALALCLASFWMLLMRPISIVAFRRAHIQHPLHGWSFFHKRELEFDGGVRMPLISEDERAEAAADEDPTARAPPAHVPVSSHAEAIPSADWPASEAKPTPTTSLAMLADAGRHSFNARRQPAAAPAAPEAFAEIELDKKAVAWKCLPNHLLVALVFCTTLSVWPGLTTELKSHQFPGLQESGWWPLLLLLLFSATDVVGRFCVPYNLGLHAGTIWMPIALRILVVPLMVLCVKGTVPFLNHDAWPVLFVAFLGFTNGYIGTLAIIVVNEKAEHPQEKRYAGVLTSFYLNVGLVLGSTVGLLIDYFFI